MEKKTVSLVIAPPNFKTAEFVIVGTAPLVINKFSSRDRETMKSKQEAGSVATKGAKRSPKDFQARYEGAKHISREGWCGIHAAAFRCGMISACRMVNFKMTLAKLSLFVEADGFDADDGSPLVKITKGKPKYTELTVRNATGVCDIRARPMWDEGWEAVVRVRFDGDQFTLADVSNLLMRVGMQVGIGEGRADSKNSAGMGWGHFTIKKTA